jgi:hypothetical protein
MATTEKNDLFHTGGRGEAFPGPEKGKFEEIEVEVLKYVTEMRRKEIPVTGELIQIKGKEISRNLSTSHLKADTECCKITLCRNGVRCVLHCPNFLSFSLGTLMGKSESPHIFSRLIFIPMCFYRILFISGLAI